MKLYPTSNPDDYPNQMLEFERKDTFSLDGTFSSIIVAGLKKFLEVIRDPDSVGGCPACFIPEGIPDYQTDPETYEKALVGASRAWQETIEEMIFAFECDPEEEPWNEYDYDYVEYLELNTRFVEVGAWTRVERTIDENESIYVKYHAKVKELQERKNRGRMLFMKYFDNLWW